MTDQQYNKVQSPKCKRKKLNKPDTLLPTSYHILGFIFKWVDLPEISIYQYQPWCLY